jgi:hypothetical protein
MTTFLYNTLITSNDTADLGYNSYLIDAASNNVTLTLPVIVSDDISYNLTRVDTSGNTVTIACDGSDTFPDLSTTTNLSPNESIMIISRGSTWYYISRTSW